MAYQENHPFRGRSGTEVGFRMGGSGLNISEGSWKGRMRRLRCFKTNLWELGDGVGKARRREGQLDDQEELLGFFRVLLLVAYVARRVYVR